MSAKSPFGDLGSIGGKAGHKATKWFKLGGAAVGIGLAAITAGGWGPFIVLAGGGALAILDMVKHPLHILRYLGAMVLFVCLLPNDVIGPTMQDVGHGFQGMGDRSKDVVVKWWGERSVTVNQTPAPPAAAPGAPVPPTTALQATLPVTQPILTDGPR